MRTEARPGRIRITADQGSTLLEALSSYRHKVVIERAMQRDLGNEVSGYNRRVEEIDRIKDEIRRTMQEMGW